MYSSSFVIWYCKNNNRFHICCTFFLEITRPAYVLASSLTVNARIIPETLLRRNDFTNALSYVILFVEGIGPESCRLMTSHRAIITVRLYNHIDCGVLENMQRNDGC